MQSVLPPSYTGNSVWHQMDARWKLVAVIIALLTLPWLDSLLSTSLALLFSVGLLLSARIPWPWWRDRMLAAGAFLLLFVAVLPFTVGETTWTVGHLGIAQRGTMLALMVLTRSLAAMGLALFLIATTTVESLLHAATRLGVPRALLRVMLISWRYVRIMYDTVEHFRIALRLRGFRNRASWQTYGTISGVVGTMLVLGFEHTERVSQAMRCRGYQGRVETLEVFQTRIGDVMLCFLLIAGFIMAALFPHFWH